MHKVPTITRLIFLPGLDVGSVGLVLDDERVAWGDCARPAQTPPLSDQDALVGIEQVVAPALVGRRLAGFRKLAGDIAALTETVIREEPIPRPEADAPLPGVSRRALLRGHIRAETPPSSPPPTRLITSEQPLHPALRYGLEQALLAALALAQNRSIAEVLADEYDRPRPTAAIPLHVQLDTDQPLESLQRVGPGIASVGYRVPEGPPADILGENGVILQGFVRGVKERLLHTFPDGGAPAIHLDLRGGLGQLYGGATGKMLGALFGLEQAASPLPLRIENPISPAGESAKLTAELQGFIRMRKMQVELAVGEIDSLETALFLAQADAYALLNGEPARLGGFSQAAEALLACRANDKRIMLNAAPRDTARSLAVLGQAALGLGADFVGVSTDCNNPALVYGEMERALVEMEVRG